VSVLRPPGPAEVDSEFDGGGTPILDVANPSDQITPFAQSQQLANDVLATAIYLSPALDK